MHPKDFLAMFSSSLNPLSYKELMHRKKREVMVYFLKLLFFCVLVSGIFSIPYLLHFPDKVDDMFSRFTRFNITKVDIEMNAPLTLLNHPKIVLDLRNQGGNATDEYLFITKQDVYVRKFKVSPFAMTFFELQKTPVSEYSDMLQNFDRIRGTYLILLAFLLPSIFFIVYTLYLIKYLLLIVLFWHVGYLICRISKAKIRFSHVMRTAVLSSAIMLLTDVAISPLLDLGMIPLAAYAVMYSVCLYAQCSKRIEDDKE